MCDPVSTAVGLQVGTELIGNSHQSALHDQNEAAALEAATQNYVALSAREIQEREATAGAISDVVRKSTRAQGTARSAAAAGGVSGQSLALLLGDFERNELEYQTNQLRGLKAREEQLVRQRQGVRSETISRIASVPDADLFGSVLRIAGAGAQSAFASRGPSTSIAPTNSVPFIGPPPAP